MVSSVLAGVKARERAVVTTQQQAGEAGGPGYNLPLNGQPHAQVWLLRSWSISGLGISFHRGLGDLNNSWAQKSEVEPWQSVFFEP